LQNRIKQLRKKKGITQSDFARMLGVSQPTVSDWETGHKYPATNKLTQLSKIFEAPVSYILGLDLQPEAFSHADDRFPLDVPSSKKIEKRESSSDFHGEENQLPKGGIANSADYFENAILEKEDISPDTIPIGSKFMMRVFDNSMKPRILENDYIVVERQDIANSGELVLFRIGASILTLKRLELERGGYLLNSSSPFFRPVFYSAEDIKRIPVKIVGKVKELRVLF